jgi:hypothetical protein
MSTVGVITDIVSVSLGVPQTTQHGSPVMRVEVRTGNVPMGFELTQSAAKDLAKKLADEVNRRGGATPIMVTEPLSDALHHCTWCGRTMQYPLLPCSSAADASLGGVRNHPRGDPICKVAIARNQKPPGRRRTPA